MLSSGDDTSLGVLGVIAQEEEMACLLPSERRPVSLDHRARGGM